MSVESIKVKEIDDGIRLNRWFLKYYPNITMGRLQKLLRTKQIKVDGMRAEASTRLKSFQTIRIPPLKGDEGEAKKSNAISAKEAEFIQSLVIYKDENIIAINKPSGLAVQGGTNTYHHIDGLLSALMFENEERPKLVHRLDKDTGGVLILARNRKAAELLTKAFREHKITKTYLALVKGCPKKSEGKISSSLVKIGEKMHVSDDGQSAVTLYKVIDSIGEKFSLLELNPLSGRTHQIRVHLASIGCPIIGDDKYSDRNEKYSLFVDKLHLHAYKIDLSFIYKEKKIITAPLGAYFADDIKASGLSFKE
ncbi:MAG: RluA family pseudouridine synthase [Alphaproteobacteria bacterium]|nr:RluA family pseudouridine synthase [Alphaproteobacteria bacterium]